ncbi:MAG: hypothetical protein KME50_18950 [Nostoc desertorum CM1-VF14]|nr:hypothetical protein [Nostoc desertorum CM1-VF14]
MLLNYDLGYGLAIAFEKTLRFTEFQIFSDRTFILFAKANKYLGKCHVAQLVILPDIYL